MSGRGGKGDRGRGRGGNTSTTDSKRPRVSSSDEQNEDPDYFLDIVVGALSDPGVMDNFVTALCGIPDLKVILLQKLLPSLNEEVKKIMQPLNENMIILNDQLKQMTETFQRSDQRYEELSNQHDDLEQYTRRQSIRVGGIPEDDGEDTDDLILDFANNVLNVQR